MTVICNFREVCRYAASEEVKYWALRNVKKSVPLTSSETSLRSSFTMRSITSRADRHTSLKKAPSRVLFSWRRRWDSNPRGVAAYLISSQGRYDHFDTPPYRTFSLYQRNPKKSRIIFLPNQLHHLLQIPADTGIVFPAVGPQAGGAVLDSLFCIPEIPPASIPQSVQGAVAEHTAEGFRVCPLVAREIFALPVLIKIVMAHSFLLFIPPSRDIPPEEAE